jgi:hypothetical protein
MSGASQTEMRSPRVPMTPPTMEKSLGEPSQLTVSVGDALRIISGNPKMLYAFKCLASDLRTDIPQFFEILRTLVSHCQTIDQFRESLWFRSHGRRTRSTDQGRVGKGRRAEIRNVPDYNSIVPVFNQDFASFSDVITPEFNLRYDDIFRKQVIALHRADPPKDLSFGLVGVEPNPGPPKKSSSKKKVTIVVQKPKMRPKRRPQTSSSSGSSVGGFLGDLAQKAIATITGMGDYVVKENTLFNGAVSQASPPSFKSSSGPGCTSIVHREYLADVASVGSAFNLTQYTISPLNSGTFPWLSAIAQNFEQYKILGMVFEFKTTSATAVSSTNTALGSVIMATQYNINEPAFVSKLQMDQYEYAVATNPSISAIHPIECAPRDGFANLLYTYTSSAGDPRLSTFGNFFIATVGQQAASVIGELWVSYHIELHKPRLFASVSEVSLSTVVTASGSTTYNSSNWMQSSLSGSNGFTVTTVGNLALTFPLSNPNGFNFPLGTVGNFLVVVEVNFTTNTSSFLLTGTPSVNVNGVNVGVYSKLPAQIAPVSGNTYNNTLYFGVSLTASSVAPFVSFGPISGSPPSTLSVVSVIITPLSF